MARRRWVQIDGELVEVTPDYSPAPRNAHTSDGLLWNDRSYDGMRATDGTDISSRTKHREYMRANNLTTMDDYKGHFDRALEAKAEYVTRGGTVTKHDIERAIHTLQQRGK